jgi:transposase
MPKESRRRFDPEFREGAVRVWREKGKSIAQVARDLRINEGTWGNWIARDQAARDGADGLSCDDLAELKRSPIELPVQQPEGSIIRTRQARGGPSSTRSRCIRGEPQVRSEASNTSAARASRSRRRRSWP